VGYRAIFQAYHNRSIKMADDYYADQINEGIRKELEAYVAGEHPYPFGSFVTALLANDLVGAVVKADPSNLEMLKDYAGYLHWNMPGRTGNPDVDYWGSYEAVKNRINDQRKVMVARLSVKGIL
jgi:hypothetical protein